MHSTGETTATAHAIIVLTLCRMCEAREVGGSLSVSGVGKVQARQGSSKLARPGGLRSAETATPMGASRNS